MLLMSCCCVLRRTMSKRTECEDVVLYGIYIYNTPPSEKNRQNHKRKQYSSIRKKSQIFINARKRKKKNEQSLVLVHQFH